MVRPRQRVFRFKRVAAKTKPVQSPSLKRLTAKRRETRESQARAPAQRQFGFLWPVRGKFLGIRKGIREHVWHLGERDLLEQMKLNWNPQTQRPVEAEVKENGVLLARGSLQWRWGRGRQELPIEVRRRVRNHEVLEAAWHIDPEQRKQDEARRARGQQTHALGRGLAGGIVGPSLLEAARELAQQRGKALFVLASIVQPNELSEAIARRQGFECVTIELKDHPAGDSQYVGYWLKLVRPR